MKYVRWMCAAALLTSACSSAADNTADSLPSSDTDTGPAEIESTGTAAGADDAQTTTEPAETQADTDGRMTREEQDALFEILDPLQTLPQLLRDGDTVNEFDTSVDGASTTTVVTRTGEVGATRTTTIASGRDYEEIVEVFDPDGALIGSIREQTTASDAEPGVTLFSEFTFLDPAGEVLTTGTVDNDRPNDDLTEPYFDRNGYSRAEDDTVLNTRFYRRPPVRTVKEIEQLGTPDAPLAWPASFDVRGTDSFSEAWHISINGLIDSPILDSVSESGTCVTLFGTVQPLEFSAPDTMNATTEAPTIMLSVDGELMETDGLSSFGNPRRCDILDAAAEGYTLIGEGSVTLGGVYPIFATWLVPPGASIDYVAVGNPEFTNAVYFDAESRADEYTPPDLSGAVEWIGATNPAASVVDFVQSEAVWQASIDDVVTTDFATTVDGQELVGCWLITGEITLIEAAPGNETESASTAGDVGLLGSHRFRDSRDVDGCDESPAVDEGYVRNFLVDLAPGETIRFYEPIFFERAITPEYVVINASPDIYIELAN